MANACRPQLVGGFNEGRRVQNPAALFFVRLQMGNVAAQGKCLKPVVKGDFCERNCGNAGLRCSAGMRLLVLWQVACK